MRAILVGSRAQRQALRNALNGASGALEVVAEFDSLAGARASGIRADAVLLSAGRAASEAVDTREALDADPTEDSVVEPLTARELEVLELVAHGLQNKQIADRLGISDQTVKFHLASLIGKLGAANRTDAVRIGVRQGIITL